MPDEADRDQQSMRDGKKPQKGESIRQEVAWIIGQMSDFWFENPGPKFRHLERFVFSWLGAMTFFVILGFKNYFSGTEFEKLVDLFGLASYIFSIVILAVAGALAALVVSSVDRGRTPFRLFFGGFFTLYLPWLLLVGAT